MSYKLICAMFLFNYDTFNPQQFTIKFNFEFLLLPFTKSVLFTLAIDQAYFKDRFITGPIFQKYMSRISRISKFVKFVKFIEI